MDRQKKLDFDRATQLAILRDARLERLAVTEGGRVVGVSGAAGRAVLRAVDDFGRGRESWPSFDTLAAVSGLSVRQVKRAVSALQAASLLVVECRPCRFGWVNHYRIVWSELALLARGGGRPVGKSAAGPLSAEWAAVVAEWRGRIVQAAELAEVAAAAGESPAAWSARVAAAWATASAAGNSGVVNSPAGAVVWFLRSGSWPVAGVVPAVELEGRASRAAARASARSAECLAFDIIRRGRRAGADDAVIRSALVAAGPGVLEAGGWA